MLHCCSNRHQKQEENIILISIFFWNSVLCFKKIIQERIMEFKHVIFSFWPWPVRMTLLWRYGFRRTILRLKYFKPIWQNRPLGPRGAGNKAGGRGWKWLEEGETADNQVTAPILTPLQRQSKQIFMLQRGKSRPKSNFSFHLIKTLPKAQRTRGLSSYHKFLHNSWQNFNFRILI